MLDAGGRAASRVSLEVGAAPPTPIGSVVRVTRPTRYSLYRGGDSRWYLGARDWNPAANRFNTTQPVSGPFAAATDRGLEFQYLDSTGAALPRPVVDTRDVAAIRITIRGQTRRSMRAFSSAHGRAGDSAVVALSIRNRR